MSTAYPAHIRKGADAPQVQTVAEHCRNTANYASGMLSGVSLAATAYLAGLLHDMGKATETFAAYIWRAFQGLPAVRGSVNHTFAAVRFLLSRYGHREDFGVYGPLTAEILAYSVGSHHGLFDGVDEKHRSGLLHRMEKQGIDYEEAIGNYLAECADLDEIDYGGNCWSGWREKYGNCPATHQSTRHAGLFPINAVTLPKKGAESFG